MTTIKHNQNASLDESELSKVRFSLASQVSFSEQHHRGEIWVIIRNNLNNKHFSTTPLVRGFIEQFRTTRSLADAVKNFPGADQMSAAELLELLSKLMSADILNSPDINHDEYRLKTHLDQENAASKSKWARPWMIKIPLGNPNKLLNQITKKLSFIWTLPAFIVWLGVVMLGTIETINNISALQHFWATRFLDPGNVLLALLIYPLLKFVHELGHGLAAKNWGADVVETGVLMIMFVPLPYVDVSQSAFFPQKHQRMFVAAAGMMFELTIAILALMVWLVTDSIFIQDICMNIILIGAVSSIFFNVNPLLKFDGYYLLSDYLEIPNLSSRAAQMSKYVLYRYVFKLPINPVAHSLKEARWLITYGVLSQSYRLMISFYIALYLGSKYFFVGLTLASWLVVTQLFKPWFVGFMALLEEAKKNSQLRRLSVVIGGLITATFLFLFVIPFQFNRSFEGILLLDGSAQVQAHGSGFVSEILVKHNALVRQGQALFNLKNTNIESELVYLENKINESETLNYQYRSDDPAQADFYRDQANAYKQEWDNLKQEQQSMTIRSPVDGYFQKLSLGNMQGTYIRKGDVVGDVISSSHSSVVLMLTEDEMKKTEDFNTARVVISTSSSQKFDIKNVEATPGATRQLPTRYLGSLYGGSVAVDTSKSAGLELLKPMFKLKLALDTNQNIPLIGSRAQIKLTSSGDPLGLLAYKTFRAVLRDRGIYE